jgi:hypothetical protein
MTVSKPAADSAKGARAVRKEPAEAASESAALQMGELSELLGYSLKRAQLKVFEDFLRCVAPLQLTPAQFSVLLLLDKNPGRNQTRGAGARQETGRRQARSAPQRIAGLRQPCGVARDAGDDCTGVLAASPHSGAERSDEPGISRFQVRTIVRPGMTAHSSTKITLISFTLVSVGPVSSRSPVAAKNAVASLLSR